MHQFFIVLKSLIVSRNNFSSLPEEMGYLTALEHLGLEEIIFTESPICLEYLWYCQIRVTEGTSIEIFPEAIRQNIKFIPIIIDNI